MDQVMMLQAVFKAIQSGDIDINTTDILSDANATVSSSSSPLTVIPSPLELPALVYRLISLPAVRDWFYFFVIGAVFEFCRRILRRIWIYIKDYFWITVSLDESEDCGHWLMFWLSNHKVFRTTRTLDISTKTFGINRPVFKSGTDNDVWKGRKVLFLPSSETTYSLWYKYHYLTVTRSTVNESYAYQHAKQILQIRIFARRHDVLRELIHEAKTQYLAERQNLVTIYVCDSSEYWKVVCTQPQRPMTSIILDPGLKNLILDDAKDFLASKEWYAERGIPHRRGYLLYGAPGSGKTSLIHGIAGELKLDVYILSLARLGMDDTSLNSMIADLPEKCIVLIEDIDAAFHRGIKRDLAESEKKKNDKGEEVKKARQDDTSASHVTLSGLLNALDGIGAQEGRILFATTNDYSALDPALLRPGRLDLHVEFKLASRYQCRELFQRFYLPSSAAAGAEDEADEVGIDSGYASRTESVSEEGDRLAAAAADTPTVSADGDSESSSVHGVAHRMRAPKLSRRQAVELADQFAATVPNRALSMATLQGYLMTYKTRPYHAVAELPAWIEKKLREEKEGNPRSDAPAGDVDEDSDGEDEKTKSEEGCRCRCSSETVAESEYVERASSEEPATEPAAMSVESKVASPASESDKPACSPAVAPEGSKAVSAITSQSYKRRKYNSGRDGGKVGVPHSIY